MRTLIFLLIIVTIGYSGSATTLTAEYSEVQDSVDASSIGDTVIVPADTAIWDTTLYISQGVVLQGAGINSTRIKNNIGASAINDYLIKYVPSTPADDDWFEVTGFTLDANSDGGCLTIRNTTADYSIGNFRIHDNRFINSADNGSGEAQAAVRIKGQVYGLLDNCEFDTNSYAHRLMGDDDNSWNNFPLQIGTDDYFYMEDNTYTYITQIIISSGEGSRWCFRYNTVDATQLNQILDAHGDTGNRGVVGNEVYENTINGGALEEYKFHDHRGGTGIIFNNNMSANPSGTRVYLHIREEYSGCNDPIIDTYVWNNINTEGPEILAVWTVDNYDCIEEDSSWWDDAAWDPGGESPSNFNYGVEASKPGSPSDDDCYYSTDTDSLWRSVGASNWTFIYTPYTYPHELRGGQKQSSVLKDDAVSIELVGN